MRVLLVEYFGRGGITHYTHCLAQAVSDLDVDTMLCTGEPYEFGEMALPYRFREVFSIYGTEPRARSGKLTKGLGYLRGFGRLGDVIREVCPDVIHIQSSSLLPLGELGLLTWIGRSAPLVYTVHNLLPHESRFHHRLAYRGIYRLPKVLIVHGDAVKIDLCRRFATSAKVHVIPHGEYSFLSRPEGAPSRSAARQWLGVTPETPVILFFGAIRAYKGLDTLLDALPEILAPVPDVQVWIAGRPLGSFDAYQAQIDALDLGEHVKTVLDYIPQERIPFYFAAADVVAAPYKKTYQSGVVQLAYAAARPVVTTRTGGLPEVVEDGKSGLLVPPDDSHALAQALIGLLRNPQVAIRMGKRGRYLARTRFSWATIARQTVDVYQEVLGS